MKRLVNGEVVEVESVAPPSTEQAMQEKQQAIVNEVQGLLDQTAQQRFYDNMDSLVSYAGDPDLVFDAEGSAGKAWRSAVWRKCYQILADVQAGTRPEPTLQDVLDELPAMVWPQ